jgi:enolase
LTPAERDKGIQDLIDLVLAVDKILQAQSTSDAEYFLQNNKRSFQPKEVKEIMERLLKAYRWQYIFSGVEHPRFQELFENLTSQEQRQRVKEALQSLS